MFSIFSSTILSKMAEGEIRENTPEIPDGENGEPEEVSFYIEDVNGASLAYLKRKRNYQKKKLCEIRQDLHDEVDDLLPRHFRFVRNGTPISNRQELKLTVESCMTKSTNVIKLVVKSVPSTSHDIADQSEIGPFEASRTRPNSMAMTRPIPMPHSNLRVSPRPMSRGKTFSYSPTSRDCVSSTGITIPCISEPPTFGPKSIGRGTFSPSGIITSRPKSLDTLTHCNEHTGRSAVGWEIYGEHETQHEKCHLSKTVKSPTECNTLLIKTTTRELLNLQNELDLQKGTLKSLEQEPSTEPQPVGNNLHATVITAMYVVIESTNASCLPS